MIRKKLIIGVILLMAGLFGSIASAQVSPSASPTSDPEGSPLVIGCDTTVYNKSFCQNDTDKECSSAADCGGGACVVQPVFVGNECTIDDFFNQFVIVAQWGTSLVTLLGLLMLVWGGVQWITAGGRSSKIEDGKRIVLGTLVGITITFTAYIIVNFTVAAITGTSERSVNPFSGPIATIFGDNPALERQFSGDGQGSVEDLTNCRANWDNTCANQIYCSDPGASPGPVTRFQQKLNVKSCGCGAPDGCFGNGTATCVRKFQLANSLEPTGIIDGETSDKIDDAASLDCNAGPVATQINSIIQAIPQPTTAGLGSASMVVGCCIINNSNKTGAAPLFCSDNMTERTCASLGSDNTSFVPNKKCALDPASSDKCGFCHTGGRCFGLTGQFWCTTVVNPPISWAAGTMNGSALCTGSQLESLRTSF